MHEEDSIARTQQEVEARRAAVWEEHAVWRLRLPVLAAQIGFFAALGALAQPFSADGRGVRVTPCVLLWCWVAAGAAGGTHARHLQQLHPLAALIAHRCYGAVRLASVPMVSSGSMYYWRAIGNGPCAGIVLASWPAYATRNHRTAPGVVVSALGVAIPLTLRGIFALLILAEHLLLYYPLALIRMSGILLALAGAAVLGILAVVGLDGRISHWRHVITPGAFVLLVAFAILSSTAALHWLRLEGGIV